MIYSLVPVIASLAILILCFCFGLYAPLSSTIKTRITFGVSLLLTIILLIVGFALGLPLENTIRFLYSIMVAVFLTVCITPTVCTFYGCTSREKLREMRLAHLHPNGEDNSENDQTEKKFEPRNSRDLSPKHSTINPGLREVASVAMYLIWALVYSGLVLFGAFVFATGAAN